MGRVVLASRAADELRNLDPPVRNRLVDDGLRELAEPPPNLDITPLAGAKPWWRLRVGDWRVLYRQATDPTGEEVVLVARIVHRSDLERAVQQL